MARALVGLVLPLVLLFALPASADFSGLATSGFTYCYAQFERYDGETCTRSDLSLGGFCAVGCSVGSAFGEIRGDRPWRITAEGYSGSGDAYFGSEVFVEAQRISADVLRVQGDCANYAGVPEIALFYFDGDPAVFEGTAALGVDELVDLGLIVATDVFWEYECSNDGSFSFDVSVFNIPDEQLLLFAGSPTEPGQGAGGGGDGGPSVPAISVRGATVLTLLMLGAGAILLRRRG